MWHSGDRQPTGCERLIVAGLVGSRRQPDDRVRVGQGAESAGAADTDEHGCCVISASSLLSCLNAIIHREEKSEVDTFKCEVAPMRCEDRRRPGRTPRPRPDPIRRQTGALSKRPFCFDLSF
jgi:hypothetical protein